MKTNLLFILTFFAFCLNSAAAFAANVDFLPRISVSEEYTDNLNLDDSDEKDDFITTVSPGFTLNIDDRSRGMNLSYDAGYSFYDEYDQYNGWRHNADFTGWAYGSRNTRLEITDTFLYTKDPEDDYDEDNTMRRDRNVYYTNSAGVSVTHQFGESDTIRLGYVYSILENDDETLEDNSRHTPSVSLTYWFVPRQWRLETGMEYTRGEFTGSPAAGELSDDLDQWVGNIRVIRVVSRNFEVFAAYTHTLVDYEGQEVDYQIYDPSVGFSCAWGEDAALSLSVGYYLQDRERGDDESGMSIDGDIGKTWSFRRSSISLTGASGYEQSYFGSENLGFDVYYMAGLSARHEFSRHVTGDVFSSYRRDKYTETEDNRRDDTTEAGCGITAQLNRWLSTRLGYTFRNVESDDRDAEYTENSIVLTFTLAPSSPI
ncbi:MAG: hypothetical protein DRH32_07005 [Deltaproteobacteria bacterium]|nr:MAG: hypothetical protein DRH32_07005 [Deltaproteobacteria bacterium]